MIHRDIKPGNILLDHAGTAKLADFGIARLIDSARLTLTAEVMGTPGYLSPEQARGRRVTPATDVYSLGLVLLECLTGSPAFPGRGVESALTRLVRSPELPVSLPSGWANLLSEMTDLDPDRRPTAVAVARTLTGLLPDDHRARTAITVVSAARADPWTGAPPRRRSPAPTRARSLTLACSAAVLVAVVAAAVVWTDPLGRPTDRLDSRPSPPGPAADSPGPAHPNTLTNAAGRPGADLPGGSPATRVTESGAVIGLSTPSNAPLAAATTTITFTTTVPPWDPATGPAAATAPTTTSISDRPGVPPITTAPITPAPITTAPITTDSAPAADTSVTLTTTIDPTDPPVTPDETVADTPATSEPTI